MPYLLLLKDIYDVNCDTYDSGNLTLILILSQYFGDQFETMRNSQVITYKLLESSQIQVYQMISKLIAW